MIRCLLVDDDALARLVLERFMGTDPELSLTAVCGSLAEASAILSGGGIDLLFLDHDLPDGSGSAFLRRETTLPRTILVTGSPEVAAEALDAGATAVLIKPLSLSAFRDAVRRTRSAPPEPTR